MVDLNIADEGALGGKTRAKTGRTYEQGNWKAEPTKTQLNRRRTQLDIDRKSWYPNWIDLANNFRPYRGRFLMDTTGDTNKGYRRNWAIVNSTPLICVNTVAAGLLAGMTSPTRPWFVYKLEDEDMMEAPGVKQWLDVATRKGRAILLKSNFYNSAFECYGEYPTFGVMAMGREWGITEDIPHFQPFTIGSYYIANDEHRRVNVFFRDYAWSVQQIVQRYATGPLDQDGSWKNISEQVKSLWFNQQYDTLVELTHAIYENIERAKGSNGEYQANASGMRFRSVVYERWGDPSRILKDTDRDKDPNRVLRIGGFRDFPVWVARWYTNSEDAWARGPAMDALGDARALQLQERRKAQAIDKVVDPPMKANSMLRNQRTSTLPGDVTFIQNEAGSVGFESVYKDFKPDINALVEDIEKTEQRIGQVMNSDIFALFIRAEDQKQPITAAQVNAEQQEKLLMLGPVLTQANTDFLNPLMSWLFNGMLTHGLLPPPPPAMRGQVVKVEYTSILAQAINAVTFGALQQFTGFVGQIAQLSAEGAQNPALDCVDFDAMIEAAADATGVPAKVVRSLDQVQQIRDQREQQQKQQQAQQAAEQAANTMNTHADTAGKLADTQMGGSSMLDQLAGAVGAQAVPNQ